MPSSFSTPAAWLINLVIDSSHNFNKFALSYLLALSPSTILFKVTRVHTSGQFDLRHDSFGWSWWNHAWTVATVKCFLCAHIRSPSLILLWFIPWLQGRNCAGVRARKWWALEMWTLLKNSLVVQRLDSSIWTMQWINSRNQCYFLWYIWRISLSIFWTTGSWI